MAGVESLYFAQLAGQTVTILEEDKVRVVTTFGVPYTSFDLDGLYEALRGNGYRPISRWEVITRPDGLVMRVAVRATVLPRTPEGISIHTKEGRQ